MLINCLRVPATIMLTSLANTIDRLTCWLGHAVSWCVLVMVVLMAFTVGQRYAFDSNAIWQTELVRALHACVFMCGAAFTLRAGGHVRIDVFYAKMSERMKAWVELLGTIIFLLPVCACLIIFSWHFVWDSWALFEASPEYGGLGGRFLVKTLLWIFSVTMALQGLSIVCRSILTLRGQP